MNNIPLHDYQIMARDFLLRTPKAGLFLDVGFGKTATTLATLTELGRLGQISGHILIIAPKPIARSTWIDEMAKWGISANVVSLIVNEKGKPLTKQKRIELYKGIRTHKAAIYFINREMVSDLIDWHWDNNLRWPFPTVVIDELQSFKSYTSERFRKMKSVTPYISRFIGLTGTPVPNGLMDLWPEIYLMDSGKRLGINISAYRDTYFNPGLIIDNRPVTWIPKFGAEEEIYEKISDIVISVQNPSLVLPDVLYNNVYCTLDDKEMKRYKELKKEQVLEITGQNGDDIVVEAANAAVLCGKLSQMASGALYMEDKSYITIHERKLEQLEYIINNTTSPVLVAYHFHSDKDQIENYLHKKGYDVRTLDGSPEMIHEWNAGNIPIMLIQPASCGHGINLQDGGHTLVWYTIPWSLEHYIQTCGRLARQGQKCPVTIHHLITKDTIDERILRAIERKDMSEKELLSAVSAEI